MAYHVWGDGFNFERLGEAEGFIVEKYNERTGKFPITKEKYGTIRYEMTFAWVENAKDMKAFEDTIKEAVVKFPDMKEEIIDDLEMQFDDLLDELKG